MKKTVKLISKMAVLILMLSITGCYYDDIVDLPEAPPATQDILFATEIQPLFTANCAGCHDASLKPNLTVGNAYTSIVNGKYIIPNDTDASLLYQRIIGNGNLMPPNGSLSTAQLNLVRDWINQGAKNN